MLVWRQQYWCGKLSGIKLHFMQFILSFQDTCIGANHVSETPYSTFSASKPFVKYLWQPNGFVAIFFWLRRSPPRRTYPKVYKINLKENTPLTNITLHFHSCFLAERHCRVFGGFCRSLRFRRWHTLAGCKMATFPSRFVILWLEASKSKINHNWHFFGCKHIQSHQKVFFGN